MKKLGFGKKKDKSAGEPEPAPRNDPFGNNSRGGSSIRSNDSNPYADAAPANDPYMSNGPAPPPYSGGDRGGGRGGYPAEKSAVPLGGYGNGPAPERIGSNASRPQENRFGAPPASDNRFGAPPASDNRFGAPPGGNRFGASPGGNRFGASPRPGGSAGATPPQQDRALPPQSQPPQAQGDRFGASGGSYGNSDRYGQDRFGASNAALPAGGSRYGAGGYGGFGSSNSSGPSPEVSAARNELFAGAQPSDGPGMIGPSGGPARGASDWESGRGDNYGQGNYGAYEDRQLTAEEQEEEDISATKQEIRFIKQKDVSSTRNALRMAAQAEETGRQTLERLGAQGESIHNTERNLDLASNQNRLAAEKARELKTLNRSMFAVHVNNPFTSGKRIAAREQKVLDDARRDRDERDATRAAAWGTAARQQEVGKNLNRMGGVQTRTGANLAERSKYQFEADSEDEAMEDEIDNNLDQLHGAAKRLNHLAGAMGREVETQNGHLERIGGKVDRVDDEIALNRSRIDRIK